MVGSLTGAVAQQRPQFGADGDGDRVVLVPQRGARLHHKALQVQPRPVIVDS